MHPHKSADQYIYYMQPLERKTFENAVLHVQRLADCLFICIACIACILLLIGHMIACILLLTGHTTCSAWPIASPLDKQRFTVETTAEKRTLCLVLPNATRGERMILSFQALGSA